MEYKKKNFRWKKDTGMETRITTAFFTSDILPKQNRFRNLSTKILFCESNSIFMYKREMLFFSPKMFVPRSLSVLF